MLRLIPLLAALAASPAVAAPQVVTDIAPVHSLTAAVMEGVGAPALLIPGDASPHHFDLRPSDAAGLAEADLVIWVGPGLTPWLEEPLETLAAGATHLTLLDTEGWTAREIGEAEDAHGHDAAHEDHAHEDAHGHEDDHAHEDEHGHEDDHGHDHAGGVDPHAWLDPAVAKAWAAHIAEALAGADPDNAAQYRANAAALADEMDALADEVAAQLVPAQGRAFLEAHAALGYFAARFDLVSAGSVSDSHDAAPGPAHLAELRDRIADEGITCLLTEPGPDRGWTDVLTEGTALRTAQVDATGALLTPGADLYPAMIRALGTALADCLS